MDKLKSENQPCLGITHHLSSTRVYYINRSFFIYTVNMIEINPYQCDKIVNVAQYLYDLLKDDPHPELTVIYPTTWSKFKKAKMNEMIQGDELSKIRFMRLLTLLM